MIGVFLEQPNERTTQAYGNLRVRSRALRISDGRDFAKKTEEDSEKLAILEPCPSTEQRRRSKVQYRVTEQGQADGSRRGTSEKAQAK